VSFFPILFLPVKPDSEPDENMASKNGYMATYFVSMFVVFAITLIASRKTLFLRAENKSLQLTVKKLTSQI
jgi:hypothetical protein